MKIRRENTKSLKEDFPFNDGRLLQRLSYCKENKVSVADLDFSADIQNGS